MSAITAKASRKMKKYAVLTREPRCFLGSFDFSWEQRKLASLCEKFTDGDWIESKDQSDFGVRLVQTGNVGVAEYLDKPNNKKWISEDTFDRLHCEEVLPGDILISRLPEPAGRACIMPLLGTKMITAVDCTIVRTAPDMSNKFLVQYLSSQAYFDDVNICLAGGTRQRISRGNLANFDVPIPVKKSEQDAIGMFFGYLDNLITLHQRKCALLFSSFQALISMMFTTSTFSWEQRKFDEVFDCTVPNNTLSRAELSYDEGTVLNVHYGDVLIKYGSVLDVQKDDIPRIPHRCRADFNGALLQDGDVIIADTAEDETTGKACEIGNLQGSAIVSGLHTMVCRPRNRMALGYLGYYLNSNAYHHQLLPLMQGIKVLSLSRSNIQKTSVSYPIAVKEQQLIAYYFSQLDNLITLHQRECISFTGRAGRLILTANKKRTTSSWEQRKLGDIGKARSGVGFPDADQGGVTGVPFFKVSDMNLDGNENEMTVANNYVTAEQIADFRWSPITELPAIFFAKVGAAVMLNRKRLCRFPFLLDNNTMAYSLSPTKWDADFAKALFGTIDLTSLVQVGALPSYNAGDVESMEIYLPSLLEQEQIGAYFKQLDHLITLHQRKPFLMKWRTSDANRNQTNRLVL